ncbi:MAG: penicillin-binding transpeptidase domain-containing protein, partial [Gemmataceae bacterium]
IGSAKMAVAAGAERQQDFLGRVGLLNAPRFQIPAVAAPLYPSPWHKINVMTVAFGQGISVSALQMATAAAAVINGGVLYRPTLVVPDHQPPGERVLPPWVSAQMRKLLRLVITGDLTGATTSGGTSTTGIAMTTLGNVVDASGDKIIFNNATTEVLARTNALNVSSATSLAHALDLAASDAALSQSGDKIAAHTGVVDWFQYSGDTYVVEAINSTGASASHTALAATDAVVQIVGVVNLNGEVLAGHTLTL